MASEKAKALAAQQKQERKAEKLRKKNSDDPRDWGRVRQIIEAYKRTNELDPELKWWTLLAVAGPIVLMLAVAWLLMKRIVRHPLGVTAGVLILGGGIGNVIDRVRFGAVVDFLQFHVAGWYYPAFNVADCAITVGAILLAWEQIRRKPVQGSPDSSAS